MVVTTIYRAIRMIPVAAKRGRGLLPKGRPSEFVSSHEPNVTRDSGWIASWGGFSSDDSLYIEDNENDENDSDTDDQNETIVEDDFCHGVPRNPDSYPPRKTSDDEFVVSNHDDTEQPADTHSIPNFHGGKTRITKCFKMHWIRIHRWEGFASMTINITGTRATFETWNNHNRSSRELVENLMTAIPSGTTMCRPMTRVNSSIPAAMRTTVKMRETTRTRRR